MLIREEHKFIHYVERRFHRWHTLGLRAGRAIFTWILCTKLWEDQWNKVSVPLLQWFNDIFRPSQYGSWNFTKKALICSLFATLIRQSSLWFTPRGHCEGISTTIWRGKNQWFSLTKNTRTSHIRLFHFSGIAFCIVFLVSIAESYRATSNFDISFVVWSVSVPLDFIPVPDVFIWLNWVEKINVILKITITWSNNQSNYCASFCSVSIFNSKIGYIYY